MYGLSIRSATRDMLCGFKPPDTQVCYFLLAVLDGCSWLLSHCGCRLLLPTMTMASHPSETKVAFSHSLQYSNRKITNKATLIIILKEDK